MKKIFILAIAAVLVAAGFVAFLRRESPHTYDEIAGDAEDVLSEPRNARRIPQNELGSAPSTEPAPSSTNFWTRLTVGDFPRLTREQVEAFVVKNNRSVDALLGALRASSGEPELWDELQTRFPDDSRVQFAAAFKAESPEERQQWLEKLKQSDPGNALANYLLAGESFASGNTVQALTELTAANGKHTLDNYLVDFMQNAEEAYRDAGFSEGEAKTIAGQSALLPEQARLKQTGDSLVDLARRYQEAGDTASAEALLQMGLQFGQRLTGTPQVTVIQELVGIAIERKVLEAMNPNTPYGDGGLTVKDQLAALGERRQGYKQLHAKTDPIFKTMSDADLGHFHDRAKQYGSVAALNWLTTRAPAN